MIDGKLVVDELRQIFSLCLLAVKSNPTVIAAQYVGLLLFLFVCLFVGLLVCLLVSLKLYVNSRSLIHKETLRALE